jgi:DNA-binding winged helix-turn-helix (wHTH) protein
VREQKPAEVIRFGLFEVDLRSGELRKSGLKIKLQQQPLQVLGLLLEKPGKLITREELQRKLWPADTFVDFDHSLNAAIKKLRQALGDTADNPLFVETLARRGYRFIAQVDQTDRSSIPEEPALRVIAIDEARARLSANLREEEPSTKEKSRWKRRIGLAIALVLAVGAVAWFQFFRPGNKTAAPPPRVIPFTSFPGVETHPLFLPMGINWPSPGTVKRATILISMSSSLVPEHRYG